MSIKTIYNNVDISNDVDITFCVLTDSNGGKQDYCKISFANGGKIWQEWTPQYNDTVRIKHGYSDSGKMFVNGIESDNKTFTLILLPTPTTAKKKKSRVWYDVKLSEVINDVAKNIGFKVQLFGFKDYTYKSLSQIMQTDISFLYEVCKKEGFNVKIYDETILIYDEKTLYSAGASGTVEPSDCNFYSFYNQNSAMSQLTIKYYDVSRNELISHTAKTDTVKGSCEFLNIRVDNKKQAERISQNLLTDNNNYIDVGTLVLKDADSFSSGSILNLSGFKGYSGNWYINESIFDVVNNNCTFKINKIRG